YAVPAAGTIEYQYIVIPTGFTEDKWVERAEVRPGNRAVVHHVIAFIREPGSQWLKDAQPGVPFVPDKKGRGMANDTIAGYAPGKIPDVWKPGQARLVKAGSDIILQMHYTANGKELKDRSRVGVVFAKEAPAERIMTGAVGTGKFAIPPGDPN